MENAVQGATVDYVTLATDIISAYVSNNSVPVADLPALISSVHAALSGIAGGGVQAEPAAAVQKATPAQIRKSITPDALVSFEDGKSYKTLKRHLTLRGLTAADYRAKYGLPSDYPTTAASYSAQRSALAKSLGLGQVRRNGAASETEKATEAASGKPKRAGRPRKVTETA